MKIAIGILRDAIKELDYALRVAMMDEGTWWIAIMFVLMLAPAACLALILCIIG